MHSTTFLPRAVTPAAPPIFARLCRAVCATLAFLALAVFAGDASAQEVFATKSFPVGSGSTTPAEGQTFEFALHTRRNDEPNAPSGTKYLMVKFSKDGKQLTGGMSQLSKEEGQTYEQLSKQGQFIKGTITKVENPLPIRPYDMMNITFFHNDYAFLDIEVIQGNAKKSLGKMRVYLKR